MSFHRRMLATALMMAKQPPFYDYQFTHFKIDTSKTVGRKVVIPFDTHEEIVQLWMASNHSLTINWGDGSITELIGNYNINDLTHIYTVGGEYTISIFSESGYMPNICGYRFEDIESLDSIIELPTPLMKVIKPIVRDDEDDDTGCGGLMKSFYGFTNLINVHPKLLYRNTNINDVSFMFYKCESLTSVPDKFFSYTPDIRTFDWVFCYCSSLTSVPVDIFTYHPNNKSFIGTFNTSGLEMTTETLFNTNVMAENFSNCFEFSKISSIHIDTFKENINATNFKSCFDGCDNLIEVGNIFDTNVNAETFAYCFANCRNITPIAELLFNNNRKATDFTKTFFKTPRLLLHSNIFCNEETEMATRFENQEIKFEECFSFDKFEGLQQGIAPQLWNYNYQTVDNNLTFNGQSILSVSNFLDIPEDWIK